MSKKKTFFSPGQLMILSGTTINDGQTGGKLQSKPNPFLDEEEEILLPDGEIVISDGEDIIAPEGVVVPDENWDEAYY